MKVKELAERQIAISLDNKLSYFSKVEDILDQYQLPYLRELNVCLTTKEKWKLQIRNKELLYTNTGLMNSKMKLVKRLRCVIWTLIRPKSALPIKCGHLWNLPLLV